MLNEIKEKVQIIDKELSIYQDKETGLTYPLNTVQLLARCDYLQLNKDMFVKAKFESKIEDLKYNVKTIKKPVPKNVITKREEDKYTITEVDEAVREVWNVTNPLGMKKSFITKEEALKEVNEVNTYILEKLGK